MAATVSARIPAPPSNKLRPTGRNPAGEWSKSAHSTLELANAEVAASSHLRGESDNHSKKLMKQVNAQGNLVNDRLKKRIKECTALRSKLRAEDKLLLSEMNQLQQTKDKLLHLKDKLTKPLSKSIARTSVRAERPPQENIDDVATKAIQVHTVAVQQLQDKLQQDCNDAQTLIEKMKKHSVVMQHDVEQKTLAIQVDEDCLHFEEAYNAQQDGTASAIRSSPSLPTASEGPYAVQKSSTNPEHWKQISGFNNETARSLGNAAKDLRLKMLTDAKRATDSQKKLNTEVVESLTKRRTQTKQYVLLMEQQMRKLDAETAILQGQQAKVQRALDDKMRPLDLVKKRLEARVNRPGREAVRDEVELELEKEFAKLVAAVESLQAKERNLESELQRLQNAKATVVEDHDRKFAALRLEEQCLEMDQLSEYRMDSRQSSRSGRGGGTPRGAGGAEEGFLPPISPRTGTPRKH